MQSGEEIREFVSPDGVLRFQVRSSSGDIYLGFEGFPWHTHGDLLVQSSESPDVAAQRFVTSLVESELIVVIQRVDGAIRNIWITDDPQGDALYCKPDEHLEFRRWNGTKVILSPSE
jgi:hypothetical protein